MPYLCHREAGTLPTLNTSKQMTNAYTRCTSLKQVARVLRNYDGRIFRDCNNDGYWIDLDCEEIHGETRNEILRKANRLFKQRNMCAA